MRILLRTLVVPCLGLAFGPAPGFAGEREVPPELRTRAESSDFRATSTYAETLEFLRRLEARSPQVKLGVFGTSEQGRPMPFVVVSQDHAFTPEAARRLSKPIVMLQGGIHAGEIDGKDALLLLLRDLALGQHPAVLNRVTLLVVPIYNVDGHERVSRFNRSNQDGPEEGMGFRTNARGLDLNRDHLKLDSAEARALIGLVNAWRPQLHVDNHVSDGFDHAWVVGWATAEAPQAAPSVDAWAKANLPAVAEATRRAGHPIGPYLELLSSEEPLRGAITPPYRPRYSTGYFALRNRPSILIETHSHKPFRTRVLGNHAWLGALLEQVARNPDALVEAVAAAERRTVALGAPDAPASDVVLRYGPDRDDPAAGGGAPDHVRLPLFAFTRSTSLVTGTPLTTYQRGRLLESDLPWFHTPRVAQSVSRPRGYVVLPGWPQIERVLRAHGLRLEPLASDLDLEVETQRLSEPRFASRPYQGTTAVTSVRVRRGLETRRLPAGSLWLPADQPDFEVAAQLLEADAPDSLVAWGLVSSVFERKEWIDGQELESLAKEGLSDPKRAAAWEAALRDPAFAADPEARSEWWARQTPYWDETIGLLPVYRVLRPLPAGVALAASRPAAPEREWRAHGGNAGHTQHSPLAQINASNVGHLRVAWTYHTGDARPDGRSQIQCNPIVVDGVLYATSAGLHAIALDAATGRELWRFDPVAAGASAGGLGVNRGVVFWSEGRERRILYSAGQTLFALDAATGQLVPGFGRGGRVDLGEGLGRELAGAYVRATTPGVVYRDLLILGSAVAEGPGPSAPGHVRAFDVRTGALRWTFHTIPQPGEYGYDTWPPDAWKTAGGANSWSGLSLDEARGIVYVPTGSPAFDFWGGDRKGKNLFGNSIVALRALTGERVWHYQLVHHDLWDRDLPQSPVLVDVRRGGRTIDAVAQATKSGHVFVLDRESGEPLFETEERAVPGSDLLGEEAWKTQPLPRTPPAFARQAFGEADATDISPASRAAVLERLRQVRSAGQFVPPSTQGTIIFPGFDGGAEWGGSAFDPQTRLLYVNANEMPWILEMREVPKAGALPLGARLYAQHCAVCHGASRQGAPQAQSPPLVGLETRQARGDTLATVEKGKGVMPAFAFLSPAERAAVASFARGEREPDAPDGEAARAGRPYAHLGYNRFLDPEGYPAVKPPWGTLNAIDLDAGEIRWSVPLGELPELTKRGIPRTGTENYGGPVVTAGGLVFIAASKDEKLRAFDKRTGEVLWETALPAGGYATPATYEAGGRQYVVIAAGGGKMGTKSGDAYVAFALPD